MYTPLPFSSVAVHKLGATSVLARSVVTRALQSEDKISMSGVVG